MGVQDSTSPTSAVAVNAAKVKALILVVVVGVLLTLGLTFLVDALLANGVLVEARHGGVRATTSRGTTRGTTTRSCAVARWQYVRLDLDDELIRCSPETVLNDEDRAYEATLAGEPTVRSASRRRR